MRRIAFRNFCHPVLILALAVAWMGVRIANAGRSERSEARWWKGNLHTHTLWSDGDNYPEMIADWYKGKDYQFLALSDHNVLSEGERWIDVAKSKGGATALKAYHERFPNQWVQTREVDGATQVRLRTLAEFRPLFEQPGKFLMIQSEEISDRFEKKPIHMNVTNVRELIKPQGGDSVTQVIQRNVDAVLEQRKRTGQPMFPHLNHPNFGWAITAEELMAVHGERFFEVYNGHPTVYNEGSDQRPGTERMWDIILTNHIAEGRPELMYGIAVDDSHNYFREGAKVSNPGRGWVMVRAASLAPKPLIDAMEAGDFYASTGVRLRDIRREAKRLRVEIEPEAGVTYRTQFIGTRKGYDARSEPVSVTEKDGAPVAVSRRYSKDIGQVLAEVEGASPSYTFKGDELYVRAKVTSSRPQPNRIRETDMESAWVQPVRPGKQ
ncbi:MAG: histidinol-phosphatase [Actinomycetota bacterium]